ncbi:MAG: hypothetical protein HC838_10155 [Spirulinaceae cyanobacterium RM2_2_10]|nr:hypothetical protein [Spirulinaceae cyanobacterium RM2_2_10]
MNREGQAVGAIDGGTAAGAVGINAPDGQLAEILPADLASQRRHHVEETLATGELQVYEYQIEAHNQPRYEEARIVPINTDEVLLVVRDITDRKQAEVELAAARDAAELANKAKGAFLASISHELRTPLNAILGFSQLMAAEPDLEPSYQEYLRLIEQSGTHLLALIEDVLTMSRLGSDRLEAEISSFDLYYLLDSLLAVLQPKAESQQLQLTFERSPDLPQWIETDKSKLRRILLSLLNNALLYTPAGQVTLTTTVLEAATADRQVRLRFEVADTGVGIPDAELDDLFVPLVQGQAGRDSGGGSGLGLSLSRELVRALGGDITVQTQVGQGSRFYAEIQVKINDDMSLLVAADTTNTNPLADMPAALKAHDLHVMSAEWCAELHRAAVIVDNQRLAELIAEIPPTAAYLSTGLSELLHNFRLDAIALLSDTSAGS